MNYGLTFVLLCPISFSTACLEGVDLWSYGGYDNRRTYLKKNFTVVDNWGTRLITTINFPSDCMD